MPVQFRVAAFDYDGSPVFAIEYSHDRAGVVALGVDEVHRKMFGGDRSSDVPALIYTRAMLRRWLHYTLEKPNPHMGSKCFWLALWQWTGEDPGFPKHQLHPKDGIMMGTYVDLPDMEHTYDGDTDRHDPLRSKTAMARADALLQLLVDLVQGSLDA